MNDPVMQDFARTFIAKLRTYFYAVGTALERVEVETGHSWRWHEIVHMAGVYRNYGVHFWMYPQINGKHWGGYKPSHWEGFDVKLSSRIDWRDDFGKECEFIFDMCNTMVAPLKWESFFVPCDGPDCGKYSGGYIGRSLCSPFGDKWLCESCAERYMLPAPHSTPSKEEPKFASERSKLTKRLRWKILERDRFCCKACGAGGQGVKLHVDHIIPIAHGGKTVEENLHVLCEACNLGKAARMPIQATLDMWEQVR